MLLFTFGLISQVFVLQVWLRWLVEIVTELAVPLFNALFGRYDRLIIHIFNFLQMSIINLIDKKSLLMHVILRKLIAYLKLMWDQELIVQKIYKVFV